MYLEYFHQHFPEVARAETRSVNVEDEGPGKVRADQYALVESYCTDPACDCRRVMLHVIALKQGPQATISFGFDRDAPMAGPYLDPINPQGPAATELLDLVESVVLRDPLYVARLERHYNMMKDKFGRSSSRPKKGGPRPQWWKKKRWRS